MCEGKLHCWQKLAIAFGRKVDNNCSHFRLQNNNETIELCNSSCFARPTRLETISLVCNHTLRCCRFTIFSFLTNFCQLLVRFPNFSTTFSQIFDNILPIFDKIDSFSDNISPIVCLFCLCACKEKKTIDSSRLFGSSNKPQRDCCTGRANLNVRHHFSLWLALGTWHYFSWWLTKFAFIDLPVCTIFHLRLNSSLIFDFPIFTIFSFLHSSA